MADDQLTGPQLALHTGVATADHIYWHTRKRVLPLGRPLCHVGSRLREGDGHAIGRLFERGAAALHPRSTDVELLELLDGRCSSSAPSCRAAARVL